MQNTDLLGSVFFIIKLVIVIDYFLKIALKRPTALPTIPPMIAPGIAPIPPVGMPPIAAPIAAPLAAPERNPPAPFANWSCHLCGVPVASEISSSLEVLSVKNPTIGIPDTRPLLNESEVVLLIASTRFSPVALWYILIAIALI